MPEKFFPLLHGNKDLIEAIKSVQMAQQSVVDIATRIQSECEHYFEEISIEDKNYNWDAFNKFDNKVLNSKICEKCGFEIKRPEGSFWKICHKCWSPMEREHTVPEKGERTFVYKCKNPKCGHVVSHT